MNLLSYSNGSLFCNLFDMTIKYNIPCLLFFCRLSSLRVASQPSADLRQFAKQEALQHTAIPAHLDKADKHTLMHQNVHKHTCTTFIRFTRMSQQDIRPLKIISDMWHERLMSISEHKQHCICVHYIWTVVGLNAKNAHMIGVSMHKREKEDIER